MKKTYEKPNITEIRVIADTAIASFDILDIFDDGSSTGPGNGNGKGNAWGRGHGSGKPLKDSFWG